MKKRINVKYFITAFAILAAFALWTLAVKTVDVRPIGPEGSSVGFAAVNGFFHSLTGVHMTLYNITDWAGFVPIFVGLGFAVLGLVQLIKRKSLVKVDFDILMLGCFYLLMLACYLLFEYYTLNYRPVLINGYLEGSYPSSTSLLVLCVMPTAFTQLRARIKNHGVRIAVLSAITVFTAFTVIGRLISGVHWLSDIVGGILLGAGLVALYYSVCTLYKGEEK